MEGTVEDDLSKTRVRRVYVYVQQHPLVVAAVVMPPRVNTPREVSGSTSISVNRDLSIDILTSAPLRWRFVGFSVSESLEVGA